MAGSEQRFHTENGGEERPLVAASAVFGRKWHPVIVRLLLDRGPLGFGELRASIRGISGKVLSESLTDLEEKGVVERTVIEEKPVRVEYSLTKRGRGLEGAIEELREWGREHSPTTGGGGSG